MKRRVVEARASRTRLTSGYVWIARDYSRTGTRVWRFFPAEREGKPSMATGTCPGVGERDRRAQPSAFPTTPDAVFRFSDLTRRIRADAVRRAIDDGKYEEKILICKKSCGKPPSKCIFDGKLPQVWGNRATAVENVRAVCRLCF